MSFIVTYYPWGPSPTIFTAAGEQSGIVTNVPADGSATVNVTFPLAYSTALTFYSANIIATTRIAEDELTVQASGGNLTGFTVYVAGGAPGSTCSVSWQSQGS